MTEVKTLSRSEREAQIKDRAGWVITVTRWRTRGGRCGGQFRRGRSRGTWGRSACRGSARCPRRGRSLPIPS
jgi:hypothetical protein